MSVKSSSVEVLIPIDRNLELMVSLGAFFESITVDKTFYQHPFSPTKRADKLLKWQK